MLGLSWYLWAVLALLPAGIFWFIRPQPQTKQPWVIFLLHYGHSAVWVWLALACLLQAWHLLAVAQGVALLAGLTYAGFILAVVKNKP